MMSLLSRSFLTIVLLFLIIDSAHAVQSTITEVEGHSCLGEDKTRKQTEQEAVADAKRRAGEITLTHMKTETRMKNLELEKDIIESYTNASIKVLQELEKGWYKDESMGDCYKFKIKAEVTPEEKAIEKAVKENKIDDPSAPLNVKVWADKKEYRKGERIKIYLKGNKPFYARVVYKDAGGNMVQLLPNPFRSDNYFNGGVTYELPTGNDRFELEVTPPLGEENITAYTSTAPLGDIDLKDGGSVFNILSKPEAIGELTRGVKIQKILADTEASRQDSTAEFAEEKAVIKTLK